MATRSRRACALATFKHDEAIVSAIREATKTLRDRDLRAAISGVLM